jgi:hypothetical protein
MKKIMTDSEMKGEAVRLTAMIPPATLARYKTYMGSDVFLRRAGETERQHLSRVIRTVNSLLSNRV